MVTIELTNINEVFTEINNIKLKYGISWFNEYNGTIQIQFIKDGYISGKPVTYKFTSLNLLHIFSNLLSQIQ